MSNLQTLSSSVHVYCAVMTTIVFADITQINPSQGRSDCKVPELSKDHFKENIIIIMYCGCQTINKKKKKKIRLIV